MTSKFKVEGLYTSPNSLSSVPSGALAQADDVVIPDQSVAEPRVGFEVVAPLANDEFSPTNTTHPVSMGFHRGETLLLSLGDVTTAENRGGEYFGYLDETDTFINYGTTAGRDYKPPDQDLGRIHFTAADNLTFLSTDQGVVVVDDLADVPRDAGMPPSLPFWPEYEITDLVSDHGWLPYNYSVAYKSVLARRDSSGRVIRGRPSPRRVVSSRLVCGVGSITHDGVTTTITTLQPHGLSTGETFELTTEDTPDTEFPVGEKTLTGGTTYTITYAYDGAGGGSFNTVIYEAETEDRSTRVVANIPYDELVDIRVGDYLELYRTPSKPGSEPGEEYYKCAEMQLTTSELGTLSATFLDIAPDSSLIEPLYSNQNTGNGQPNEQPPVAQDTTWWDDRVWFGNTNGKQRIAVELIGIGTPNGLQVGDKIFIDGNEFTADAANFSSSTFPLYEDSGSPSVNVARTAANISHMVDYGGHFLTENFYVYVTNGGTLNIEAIRPDQEPFTFYSSRLECFAPQADVDTPITSTNDDNQHWLFYSQPGEPEHVPLLNYLPVGSKNDPIKRIFGFRDRLYVFKKTEGIFVVTGPFPYRVSQISNAKLVSSETVCVLGEQVWGFFDQGLASISDAGITVVSRAIEDRLQEVVDLVFNDPDQYYVPFGVTQESSHQYHLWVPKGDGTNETECYVYNLGTNTWVRWTKEGTAAVLDPLTDRVYLGATDSVLRQRLNVPNTYRRRNYADESYDFPGCSTSGTTLTLPETDDAVNIEVDGLIEYDGNTATVVSVTSGTPNYTIELDGELYVDADTVTYYTPIDSVIQYHPLDLGDPGRVKVFRDVQAMWGVSRSAAPQEVDVTLKTDVKPGETTYTWTNPAVWGSGFYGAGFWGGTVNPQTRIHPVPHQYATAGSLTVTVNSNAAWAPFRFLGLRVEAEGGGEEPNR